MHIQNVPHDARVDVHVEVRHTAGAILMPPAPLYIFIYIHQVFALQGSSIHFTEKKRARTWM